jgi:hypothetical protein
MTHVAVFVHNGVSNPGMDVVSSRLHHGVPVHLSGWDYSHYDDFVVPDYLRSVGVLRPTGEAPKVTRPARTLVVCAELVRANRLDDLPGLKTAPVRIGVLDCDAVAIRERLSRAFQKELYPRFDGNALACLMQVSSVITHMEQEYVELAGCDADFLQLPAQTYQAIRVKSPLPSRVDQALFIRKLEWESCVLFHGHKYTIMTKTLFDVLSPHMSTEHFGVTSAVAL